MDNEYTHTHRVLLNCFSLYITIYNNINKAHLMDNIRLQLQEAIISCQERGLISASQWAAEMLMGMTPVEPLSPEQVEQQTLTAEFYRRDMPALSDIYMERANDPDSLRIARVYFDKKEYRRCVYALKECHDQKSLFLRLYARYMAGEKDVQDICMDVFGSDDSDERVNAELVGIVDELKPLYKLDQLDGFNCYLLGVALRQQQCEEEAIEVLIRSLTRYPLNWSAWLELGKCFDTFDKANVVLAQLSDHFTRTLFQCYLAIERFSHFEVTDTTVNRIEHIFPTSGFIKSLRASEAYKLQDFVMAEEHFNVIRQRDPYRLEQMDTLSHVLFVNKDAAKLSILAHDCEEVDRFRPETCLVLGNYYGLRQDHEKAILYYRRALKLDRRYVQAWTLMGHEYLELGNMHAAIEAYRRAIDIDSYDYRALFALGHAYEMLRLFHYAITYFEKATAARPLDARMWKEDIAAIKCYQRALIYEADKNETLAKLAFLYKKQKKTEQAIMCYKKIISYEDDDVHVKLLAHAFYELANHEKEQKRYDEALGYINRMLDLDSSLRDEARTLNREIIQLIRRSGGR
ncbi:anaphase promoting complex subunit 8 [Syncephalis plumigaleata]|nr:anaphase promoting complex subunit 8 [Syncephalis plumigaleata]